MNDNYLIPLKIASDFVIEFFNKNLPEWALYHSLGHTIDTVEGCREIGEASGFSGMLINNLIVAGWFHDTGYVLTTTEHEEVSCKIAQDFLVRNKLPGLDIDLITRYIMATKTSNHLSCPDEFVIRDADLISLGRDDYFEKNNLLKLEIEKRENIIISEIDWLNRSINFLKSHRYFTDYAIDKYGSGVEKNLERLGKKLSDNL